MYASRVCFSTVCAFFERWESLSASRVLSSQCTSRDGVPGLEHVRLVCRFVNGRCQSPRRTGSWRRGVDARPVGLSRTFCDENLRLVARLRLLVPRCDTVNDEGCLHTLHHLAQSEGSPWIVWLIVLCCVTAHRCPSATVQLRNCGKQLVVTQVSLLTPDNTQSLCTVGDCRRVSEV